jgi:hypothetical protein
VPEPELTVVVPVWDDYVRFLPECVESILARPAGGYDDESIQEEFGISTLLPFLADVEVHREPGRRYRIHARSLAREPVARERLEAQFRSLRRRVRRHPDVPLWAKGLLPLAALSHRRRIAGRLRLFPPPAP